jgi:hypothetical protein
LFSSSGKCDKAATNADRVCQQTTFAAMIVMLPRKMSRQVLRAPDPEPEGKALHALKLGVCLPTL